MSMAPPATYVLHAPWSLFDRKADEAGFMRVPLSKDSCPCIPAGRPIYIATTPDVDVRPSGFKMAAQPLPGRFRIQENEFQLYLLSVGVRPTEGELEIEIDGAPSGRIFIDGYTPRPTFSAGKFGTGTPELKAEQLDLFLLAIVDLIQMVADPRYELYQIVWERLQYAWMDEQAESTIPPLSLIVRHADHYANLVKELLEKPRRLLQRQRDLTPVDRVQQLDVACVRWLSKQPGTTHYERAGPRQQILAVRRHETINTLENRVLRDFSLRTHREASRYTKRYDSFSQTHRWKSVNRHGQRCKRAIGELIEAGVTSVNPPVIPNFVLLQDTRYRHLWRAYLEIMRLQDEEDECWRWQHRLWSDFTHLLLHLSLRQWDGLVSVAEHPLRIHKEQERGAWAAVENLSGVWMKSLTKPDGSSEEVVLSLIWNIQEPTPPFAAWLPGLGCDAAIRIQRLSDQAESYIALWGYHGFSADPLDIEKLAASCGRSVANMRTIYGLSGNEEFNLKGLVLVSTPFGFTEEADYMPARLIQKLASGDDTVALRVGVQRAAIKRAMRSISSIIEHQVTTLIAAG